MSEELKKKAESKAAEKANLGSGIIVEDPEILRPREFPLVVKPESGAWANKEQEKFARTLNGYAYKNPEKWKVKKDVLIKQLKDLEKNPENLLILEGGENPNLKFKNTLIEK